MAQIPAMILSHTKIVLRENNIVLGKTNRHTFEYLAFGIMYCLFFSILELFTFICFALTKPLNTGFESYGTVIVPRHSTTTDLQGSGTLITNKLFRNALVI